MLGQLASSGPVTLCISGSRPVAGMEAWLRGALEAAGVDGEVYAPYVLGMVADEDGPPDPSAAPATAAASYIRTCRSRSRRLAPRH
jgi:hypothetical protein